MSRPRPHLKTVLRSSAVAMLLAIGSMVVLSVRAQMRPVGVYDNTEAEQEALRLYHEEKLITARTKAEELLKRRPNSLIGHYVLGAVLHEAEGSHARAMRHLGQARELYETSWNAQAASSDAPQDLHRELLYHIARLANEMELWEYAVDVLGYHDNLYDPDLIGERAWPLMQLGRVEEARQFARTAIQSRNRWQRSSGLNALCAIEALTRQRQPYYEACKAALEDARRDVANRAPGSEDEGAGITVDAYNAAIAAMNGIHHQEAEQFALEGVRRLEFTPANPWRFLVYLYLLEGRFDDSIEAIRSMQSWRRRQPASLRDQSHAENDAALATLLLTGGLPDAAIESITRALDHPDRRGLTTGTEEQARGHHALLRRVIRRAYAEHLAEEASWGQAAGFSVLEERVGQRLAGWADDERIVGTLAEEDLLVSSLRPYVDHSMTSFTYWLTGELIDVAGSGVFAVALEEAREIDRENPEVAPYYEALEAELLLRRGDAAEALQVVPRVLTQLPPQEVLLQARLCAVGAEAAEEQGNSVLAMSYYEQILQKDPGTLRRMGLRLPATVRAQGGGPVAEAASFLEDSPRIQANDRGFQILVSSAGPVLRACLRSPQGNEIRCVEVHPQPEEPETPNERRNEDTEAEEAEDEDEPEPLTLAQQLAREFNNQVFSPQIALSRVDLQSLDGRTTAGSEAVRDELENIFQDTVTGGN